MTALFWRLFLLNGLVFVAGAGVLVLSPATVSTPVSVREVINGSARAPTFEACGNAPS